MFYTEELQRAEQIQNSNVFRIFLGLTSNSESSTSNIKTLKTTIVSALTSQCGHHKGHKCQVHLLLHLYRAYTSHLLLTITLCSQLILPIACLLRFNKYIPGDVCNHNLPTFRQVRQEILLGLSQQIKLTNQPLDYTKH